jgi:hypothetical protein
MQSRMGPGSQRSCGLRPGHEKKNGPSSRPQPNLIPLWVGSRFVRAYHALVGVAVARRHSSAAVIAINASAIG